MARKGENIYKRKDGRWEGRYGAGRLPDGRARYRSVYGKTYREVKEKLLIKKRDACLAGGKENMLPPGLTIRAPVDGGESDEMEGIHISYLPFHCGETYPASHRQTGSFRF